MNVAVLGSKPGWHAAQLQQALTARGHSCTLLPISRMLARTGLRPFLSSLKADLDSFDFVLVRFIPRGSLEQIIFRMDALHLLAGRGVRVINRPRVIELTVDKLYTSGLLEQAGLPTPRTIVCEESNEAMQAFSTLGGDVVVKPLFGSMGRGLARVEDEELAYRLFKALDIERAVYYLQETIPHHGYDIRAFVIGGRLVAAAERVSDSWRTNFSRGARVRPAHLTPAQTELCLRAAAAVGTDYAGVDLLPAKNGQDYLLEVNSVPGWEGLQSVSAVNIAQELVAYLEAEFSQSRPRNERPVELVGPLDA
mgnify:CR=1 FL=1